MVSFSSKIEISSTAESHIKTFWMLGIGLLLVISLSLYQIWKPSKLIDFPASTIASPSTNTQQEVHSWLLNYSELSQAQNRHSAFRKLTKILHQNEEATQAIEQMVLLNQQSSIDLLAVTVGALSSQGTLPAQQALCHTLQAFRNTTEKAMLVLPQLMLLEKPQDFLFDELQTFIRKTHNPILRENAELTLAGLSQQAYQTNRPLAQKITLWLEGKKTVSSKRPESLATFLDLLGNTSNEAFLADILQATTHEDAGVRARAAFALRLFQGEQVVSTLKQLATDPDLTVQSKATEALSYFAPTLLGD